MVVSYYLDIFDIGLFLRIDAKCALEHPDLQLNGFFFISSQFSFPIKAFLQTLKTQTFPQSSLLIFGNPTVTKSSVPSQREKWSVCVQLWTAVESAVQSNCYPTADDPIWPTSPQQQTVECAGWRRSKTTSAIIFFNIFPNFQTEKNFTWAGTWSGVIDWSQNYPDSFLFPGQTCKNIKHSQN